MLDERAKRLLDAPQPTETRLREDTYPRVLAQQDRGDGHQLVTFALPGLRRVRAWVPETRWVNGDHLSMHAPMVAMLERCVPPLQPDDHGFDPSDVD